MTAVFGRLFQLVGLILLPLGLMLGLFRNSIGLEVRLLLIGGGLFVAGWLMARQKSQ